MVPGLSSNILVHYFQYLLKKNSNHQINDEHIAQNAGHFAQEITFCISWVLNGVPPPKGSWILWIPGFPWVPVFNSETQNCGSDVRLKPVAIMFQMKLRKQSRWKHSQHDRDATSCTAPFEKPPARTINMCFVQNSVDAKNASRKCSAL